MLQCRTCGGQNPDKCHYCGFCGKALFESPASQMAPPPDTVFERLGRTQVLRSKVGADRAAAVVAIIAVLMAFPLLWVVVNWEKLHRTSEVASTVESVPVAKQTEVQTAAPVTKSEEKEPAAAVPAQKKDQEPTRPAGEPASKLSKSTAGPVRSTNNDTSSAPTQAPEGPVQPTASVASAVAESKPVPPPKEEPRPVTAQVIPPPPAQTVPPQPRYPILRPEVQPPVTAPKPQTPRIHPGTSGVLVWSGVIERNGEISITGSRASTGSVVSGELPGVPVQITVEPPEFGLPEPPGQDNQWRSIRLRSLKKRHTVITIHWTVI